MAINFRCFFLGCRTGARLAKALASYALFLLALPALAQSSLPEVRVQAGGAEPASERATVGVIGDEPIATTPQSVSLIRNATLRDLGAASLSSAIRSETSAGDAYNTLGYVETIQVRGFTLDNALNFRRDGMRISNHAPMAFENKDSIEILKGVSGTQSGVSAPGGLVNYVLKRPTESTLREVTLGVSERGTTQAHADFGGRFGADSRLGYRINLAAEKRRPEVNDAPGRRNFLSGFFDFRLPNDALLEAEFEHSRVSQRSVPGFGLLDVDGDGQAETLPAPIDPRINLNNQPWSQPFESINTLGSLRFSQAFATSWSYGLRYGAQNIRTNDRVAFPDGCRSG
ncbi:MAG: TonB-dependent receptor plug domain-containing protein, partial [Quisquiliibacterium sp.]